MTKQQRRHVEALDEPSFLTPPEPAKPLWFLVEEADAVQLMAGKVPEGIREQARAAIDWEWSALKRGERPILRSPKP